MIDPVDPAERDPNYDWRTEVDWPHVRRLILLHALYWAFGAAQATLSGRHAGRRHQDAGRRRRYLAWAALAVLLVRAVARARYYRGSAHVVSPRTFLILVAFMASLCAYILLLSLIDMDTIELLRRRHRRRGRPRTALRAPLSPCTPAPRLPRRLS